MDDKLTLLLDVIMIGLLVATIVYAFMLNSRLAQLRDNRDEMARLIAAFNDATARAESGIPKLKRAAEEASQTLQERVEKAQLLRDDLAFMVERADTMAGKLESSVRQAREEVRPAAPPPAMAPLRAGRGPARSQRIETKDEEIAAAAVAAAAVEPEPVEDDRSEAERELLRALQAVR